MHKQVRLLYIVVNKLSCRKGLWRPMLRALASFVVHVMVFRSHAFFLCIQSVFDVIVSAVLTAIRLELRYILAGADDRSLQQKKPQS